MARKNLLVLFAVVMLALSGLACGGSPAKGVATEAPVATGVEEVDEAVEELVEGVTNGTPCEYAWISKDVQHRLVHYRACTPEKGEEQKRLDALQEALDDCFELCDENCPDENNSKTQANLDCVAQCKAE